MHEPSPAQKAYLARQKRDRRLVVSARLLVFLIFLAQWEILARAGWIDSFIFSSPSMIFKTFMEMAQNHSLFIHIGATLKETLLSFLFVVVLGLGISILLWGCPRLAKVLEPYLVVLNSLPKSALAPLLIVWLGARQRTIIIAGMSVAFPLGVGLALVLGVFINYFNAPQGSPVFLFLGVLLVIVAIVFNAWAYKNMGKGGEQQKTKGIVAGIMMSFFFRFIASSMDLQNFECPEVGKMTPYTAMVIFSIGIFTSNFIFNTAAMRRPFVGTSTSYGDYFAGSFRLHAVGILGGIIWGIGNLFSLLATEKAGAAISYGLGQGATMVAAFWGVFIWKEFVGGPKINRTLLTCMFILFLSGIGLIIYAGL